MHLNCLSGPKYQPLCESLTSLDLHLDSSSDTKQAEVHFYNENESFSSVIVEENLRACDLCQLLALKNHVAKDVNWALIEHDANNGLERCLEDHEEVLRVYVSWGEEHENKSGNKFYFRKNFQRYEYFDNPQLLTESDSPEHQDPDASNLKKFLLSPQDENIRLHNKLWQLDNNTQVWKKAPCLLTNGCVYQSASGVDKDEENSRCLADLRSYSIYTLVNEKSNYKIPTDYCFCLKPTDINSENERKALYFGCESDGSRSVWITALRLVKYGKQLRENYRIFKQRNHMESSGPFYSGSARSRVAMDFTGNYGKIVNDPKEADAVAKAEGHEWKKKLRVIRPSSNCLRGLEFGVHVSQPWFYGSLSREEAVQLLAKELSTNGTFLVRESHSSVGAFVLSFVHSEKIYHSQIVPIQEDDKMLYSLDNGKTKFYDILQLIEFYQLNCGSLPMKLTHYIVPVNSCRSLPCVSSWNSK